MTYNEIKQAILDGAMIHLERMNKELERSTWGLSEHEIEQIKEELKALIIGWTERQ